MRRAITWCSSKTTNRTLLNDIRLAFAPPAEGLPPRQQRIWDHAMDTATTLNKGHGRIERRTLKATTALNDYLDWPGAGQSRSRSERGGQGRQDLATRSATSSPCFRGRSPARTVTQMGPGALVGQNRSHYVRDVTMGEDASRIRERSGP